MTDLSNKPQKLDTSPERVEGAKMMEADTPLMLTDAFIRDLAHQCARVVVTQDSMNELRSAALRTELVLASCEMLAQHAYAKGAASAAEQARAEERSRILTTLQESANAVRKMKLMQTNSTELQKYAADSIEAAIDIIRARGAKP